MYIDSIAVPFIYTQSDVNILLKDFTNNTWDEIAAFLSSYSSSWMWFTVNDYGLTMYSSSTGADGPSYDLTI